MSEVWERTKPIVRWECLEFKGPHDLYPALVPQRMTPGPTDWPSHWYCIHCRLIFQNLSIETQSAASPQFAGGA